MYLPESIRRIIGERQYESDDIGKSAAKVHLYGDAVLKIGAEESEYRMLTWLCSKGIPVPKVLAWEQLEGVRYLLMSRMNGEMLCSDVFLNNPRLLIKRMAEALEMLWTCDASDCPKDASLAAELAEAGARVEAGVVSFDGSSTVLAKCGFASPEALYKWLCANRPDEKPVLSHGDFCLPNVFADASKACGFIDVGACGRADMYRDIALGYNSLYNNFEGCFSRPGLPRVDYDDLFVELGITPDRDKLLYYRLLDNLYA